MKHKKSNLSPRISGALERFHQSLKSMLKRYCLDCGKDWDEGVPLVLFAAHEARQDSLGFNPTELVFRHSVHSPLKVLKKSIQSKKPDSHNVLDCVNAFCESWHNASSLAKQMLCKSQGKMKENFDRKAVFHNINVGDKVLVLVPTSDSDLSSKFVRPYIEEIKERLNDLNHVISTPDHRCKSRMCHINMLFMKVVL